MTIPTHGTVHGKTIQLSEDPGLPEGQEVLVVVTVQPQGHVPGDGIRRSAGAWANDPEIDAAFEQIERERKAAPLFGRCKGMLTIVNDDDEHLRDWTGYLP